MLLLDIDHFKTINDQLGHAAGDECLRKIGEIIRNTVRGGDTAGRIGGEEFLVVMPGRSRDIALTVGERLRLAVALGGMRYANGEPVTTSIGVAAAHVGETAETLLARADRGLYEAKRQGRNRLVEDLDISVIEHLAYRTVNVRVLAARLTRSGRRWRTFDLMIGTTPRLSSSAHGSRAGLSTIVTVGCDVADSFRALECAREYRIYSSVGIHPHEAKDAPADIPAIFDSFLRDSRVVAIGEAGLDYYYDHSPRDVQRRVLREQLDLAREASFPFIFHQRDAFEDFVAILREQWRPPMRGVVHCFTGDAPQAQILPESSDSISASAASSRSKRRSRCARPLHSVGLQSLVLETDCPYLAPVPHRGERNEPAYVAFAAQRIAEVLECGFDDVVAATDANARALFPIR